MIAPTWQSQASLSLFLVLLVISIFVLPAMGGRHVNIKLALDILGSLKLIAEMAIAWGGLGLLTIGIAVAIPTLIFCWTAWALPGRFSPGRNDRWTITAILVIGYILLARIFRAGPINAVVIQGQ